MDALYLTFIIIAVVAGLGLSLFLFVRSPDSLRKYWRYIAGAVGSVVGVLGIAWLADSLLETKTGEGDPELLKKEKELREKLGVSRSEMEEELLQAREEEQEVRVELEEIDQIENEPERLQRLADLWNIRRGR